MRSILPDFRHAGCSLLSPVLLAGVLLAGAAAAQTSQRPAATATSGLALPLPPPPAPSLEAVPPPPVAPPAPPSLAASPSAAPASPVAQPVPPAAAPAGEGAPLQRRIGLAELGLPAGLAFGADGRDLVFPLPRNLSGLAARLVLTLDLTAPFGGRQAVQVQVNGRLLDSRAFGLGETRMTLDLAVPAADLARMDGLVLLRLRLLGDSPTASPAATATLDPESHLALLLPDAPQLSVAALFRLLPRDTRVLLRPGPISPAEAAAALRIGLALTGTGRIVSIASAPPGQALRGRDGTRLWDTGTVLVGQGTESAAVRMIDGLPVLTLGGAQPESAARLLDSRWSALAAGEMLQGGVDAPPPPATTLPFAALRGSTAPQDRSSPQWDLDFSTRDLPPGTRPQAIELELRAAPHPAGQRAVATVLLNQVILGTRTLSTDGQARLALPVPPGLLSLDNRIQISMQRGDAMGPAQVLPSSLIRLGPAPSPQAFLDLPPAFAAGVQVLADAPGGTLLAEQLNPLLWVLRALVPSGAPISVSLAEPGVPAAPSGAFLAATLDPPEASAPSLRFDAGRVLLSNPAGEPMLDLAGVQRAMVVQLVQSGGHAGLWLRALGPSPLLPAAPPRLDRGDVALLDASGVALAWRSAPASDVRLDYPDQMASQAGLLALRPWIVGVLWLLGLALVAYAFIRPRRDKGGRDTVA